MFGWYRDGEIVGGLTIPRALSLLAHHDPDAPVRGLDAVPPDERPPVNVVRVAFQAMVAIGTGLALLAAIYLLTWWRRRGPPESPWFYRAAVAAGPLAVVALEAGWITTEVGRQPWIVYELMRVDQAVTGAGGVPVGYGLVAGVYALLTVATAAVLIRMARAAARGGGAMSLADLCAALIVLGLTAYAVLAGADFGAGLWDLAAGRGRRGERARALIVSAMGPVWEANHVWLIFVLVVFWTCFPVAFGSVASTLAIPLFLAALGIIFRGGTFAFRGSAGPRTRPAVRALFALSSLLTPFFLGAAVGAVASGRVPVGNAAGDPVASWWNPTGALAGALAALTGVYLAAVYLAADARRADAPDLAEAFRLRALAVRRRHRRGRHRRAAGAARGRARPLRPPGGRRPGVRDPVRGRGRRDPGPGVAPGLRARPGGLGDRGRRGDLGLGLVAAARVPPGRARDRRGGGGPADPGRRAGRHRDRRPGARALARLPVPPGAERPARPGAAAARRRGEGRAARREATVASGAWWRARWPA